MKIAALALVAAFGSQVYATDATVSSTMTAPSSAQGLKIASQDILNRPTGLLNKNTVLSDNNVFIARSNILLTQNDRMELRKKVHEALMLEAASTAVLTKNVMRAVSSPTTDSALMSKASAVVAARGDDVKLPKMIADFVDTAAKHEMDREEAMHDSIPRGVTLLAGTKSILRQPTGVVNKNVALTDDQISFGHSVLSPSQNDAITMKDNTKVGDAILPSAKIRVGSLTSTKTESATAATQYRTAFMYKLPSGEKSDKEFFGGIGGIGGFGGCGLGFSGCGLGWRYPLGWWGLYGGGLLGGCGLGFAYGPWFYC